MSPLTICLIIFVLTVISYCWGKVSMATTALTSLILLSLFGCLTADEALAYFGDSNVVMIGGMCVVAAGFNRTKFCKSIADAISKMAKGSLTKIMAGYIILGIILSQFIQSPVVAFGIVAPMLAASAESMGLKPSKVMFGAGVATVITCCTLPVGAGATVAAELNGYLEANNYTEFTVGLLDPMKARFPMVILVAIYCIFIAAKLAPEKPVVNITEMESKKDQKEALPPFKEKCGYIIFILVTVALILQNFLGLESWVTCLVGALAMVLTGVLSDKEAISSINWPIGFLYIGSMAMGGALSQTGAGEVVGNALADVVRGLDNPYLIGLVFFIVPFLLTQIMMNRTVMLIFIPIAILACKSMGANPVGIIILT